eukprot:1153379-Pelagomonas_calceolata.AAC.6
MPVTWKDAFSPQGLELEFEPKNGLRMELPCNTITRSSSLPSLNCKQDHELQVLEAMLQLGCHTVLVTDATDTSIKYLKSKLGSSTDPALLEVSTISIKCVLDKGFLMHMNGIAHQVPVGQKQQNLQCTQGIICFCYTCPGQSNCPLASCQPCWTCKEKLRRQ